MGRVFFYYYSDWGGEGSGMILSMLYFDAFHEKKNGNGIILF
jgi:hypothetical protein